MRSPLVARPVPRDIDLLFGDRLRRSLVAMHDATLCPVCGGRGRLRGTYCVQCEGNGIAPLAAG